MDAKKVIGVSGAGIATFMNFIAICIFWKYAIGGTPWFSVMTLLAFLAGGLCVVVRIADLLADMGTITVAFIKDNKKMIALLILGAGCGAAFLAFLSFIGFTADVTKRPSALRSALMKTNYGSSYICVILSLPAHAINVIIGAMALTGGATAAPAS